MQLPCVDSLVDNCTQLVRYSLTNEAASVSRHDLQNADRDCLYAVCSHNPNRP